MSDNKYADAMDWLGSGDTGVSSECLVYAALGKLSQVRWNSPPIDPSDLGRCLRMMVKLPWVRDPAFAALENYPEWKLLLENWDKLAALMEEEVGIDWRKGRFATKTYEAMKTLEAR